MECKWVEKPLGSIIQFKNGKKRPTIEGDIPVYGGNGILGYTSNANYDQCVIIGRVGAYCGSVYYEENACWVSDNAIAALPKNGTDIVYVYYLLKGLNLNKRHIGTSQPLLTQEILNRIEYRIPSLAEQRKIGAVLHAFDHKIAVNSKIIDNLLKQLTVIYKSWYRDFSLINDSDFVDTEYGKVPRGWKHILLGDLCQSISVTHKFDKEELIFLNTGDIEDGRFLHSNYMTVKDMPGQAKKTIVPGDILYSEIRPINRHFAYVNIPSDDYVVSTKLMVIRAKNIDSRRLYHYLTSDDILIELQHQAESRSGTFPQIRFENVSRLPILIADERTESKFTDILHSVYDQIDHLTIENEKLAELRDSILPKLMTGEIDMSDINI